METVLGLRSVEDWVRRYGDSALEASPVCLQVAGQAQTQNFRRTQVRVHGTAAAELSQERDRQARDQKRQRHDTHSKTF